MPTFSQRKADTERRNARIVEEYLRAWNTQEDVAELTGVERSSVSRVMDNVKNGQLSIFHKTFERSALDG